MWLPDAKTLCKSERLVSALVTSKSIDLLLARSVTDRWARSQSANRVHAHVSTHGRERLFGYALKKTSAPPSGWFSP